MKIHFKAESFDRFNNQNSVLAILEHKHLAFVDNISEYKIFKLIIFITSKKKLHH